MRFKFDDFVVDGDRRCITSAAGDVPAAPKTLEILLALLVRAPNAVSKAELLSAVWPDTHVSEATLTGVIADAREALRDNGRDPKIIRTVQRFGYAFVATVEREMESHSTLPVAGWLITDGWRVPLRAGETILGREGDGVVPLPSSSVSRQHAAVMIEGAAARLRDLGSKNGTFVDEIRVDCPMALRDGARLRFGTLEVIYRSNDAGSSTDTV